jgi:hypothetical protein
MLLVLLNFRRDARGFQGKRIDVGGVSAGWRALVDAGSGAVRRIGRSGLVLNGGNASRDVSALGVSACRRGSLTPTSPRDAVAVAAIWHRRSTDPPQRPLGSPVLPFPCYSALPIHRSAPTPPRFPRPPIPVLFSIADPPIRPNADPLPPSSPFPCYPASPMRRYSQTPTRFPCYPASPILRSSPTPTRFSRRPVSACTAVRAMV